MFINDFVKSLDSPECDPIVIGDLTINSLLYADDIILLSNSEEGLQKSLNCLNEFCDNWKLNVNHEKLKVTVFNSNGKAYINHFKFHDKVLETVKSFCYLGITIKYTGTISASATLLMEKGRKAFFKIKQCVGFDNPCSLLEKLFDSLVSPIILYCSELWGINSAFKDSDPYEYLHLKFIKEILGVHCKATNTACRSELKRLPLKAKIKISTVKFFERILSSHNTLVNKIYLATENTNTWTQNIKNIVNRLAFSRTLSNASEQIQVFIKHMQVRINDQVLQEQVSFISISAKLDFYKNLYDIKACAHYVDLISCRSERSILAKIRLSAHNHAVQKGRHNNIFRPNRICPVCSTGSVENEDHFLLKCTAYRQLREEFFPENNQIGY